MSQDALEERLLWLLGLSRDMLATRDLERLLVLVTDGLIEVTKAERGFVLLKDRETGKLEVCAGRAFDRRALTELDSRIGAIALRVVKEGKAIFATDAAGHDFHVKTMVCIPLRTETDVLGVLYADGHGSPDAVAGHGRRVAELLADHAAAAIENARMFERATNDPLTGLPNSSYFLLQLGKVVREATPEAPAGVLLLDVDAFKRVNLAAGAEMGDRALVDIAATLQDVLRADGLVARYGSDKFGILLPPDDTTPVGLRLRDVAERARAAVATKTYHGVAMSVSIGGVAFPAQGVEAAGDVVAAADDALGRARSRGHGQVEIG